MTNKTENPYFFHPDEKTAIFIDGANFYATARALGFDIDYKLLLQWCRENSHLLRAYYYTAVFETQDYSPIRPLADWLDYNGFTMVTKTVREQEDSQGRIKIKGGINIDMAVDMFEVADKVDHIILFSGDGEFRRLIEALQRRGVRVSVASSVRSDTPMISDELRRQADQFIELDDLAELIQRINGTHSAVDQNYFEGTDNDIGANLKTGS